MRESRQRWQTTLWIGDKIDQPVTLYGASLEDLQIVVRRFLEEHQPAFFSTTSPNHQGFRRTSYVLFEEGHNGVRPGWHWLDDRVGPLRLNSFEQTMQHVLSKMLIEHGPGYDECAAWRLVPVHEIRMLRREVCRSEEDWLRVEEALQDGWCLLHGRLAEIDERGVGHGTAKKLLLGQPNPEARNRPGPQTLRASEAADQ